MKGYRLQLVRHGITQANIDGEYIGTTDLPLCHEGVEELYSKIEKYDYPNVQKVYTSPLKRCKETANILYPNRYTVEIPELREMDFGDYEGKKAVELMEREDYKEFLKGGIDNPPPNGESMRQVVERCYTALAKIIADMMKEGLTNCAVVTHGGLIMNMLSCYGLPKLSPMEFACDFGEGFEVMISAAMWQRSSAFEIVGRFPQTEETEEQ